MHPLRLRSLARALLVPLLLLSWLLLAGGRGGYFGPASPPGATPRRRTLQAHEVRVLDGDTFLVRGELVRLLGADCPEKGAAWFRGDQEPWAGRAQAFSAEALRRAGRIELLKAPAGDERGRALAHLLLDGEPLAALLVEAGLAWPTVSRFGDGGYPQLAAEVLRRARRPEFEPPWRWRRAHRRPE